MKLAEIKWVGIDYGAKLSGNTAVVWQENAGLHCAQSLKGKDSDIWLKELLLRLNPERIFIDAPLSLPSVYSTEGQDYFYRQCDRECKAMSPMFIGGLTARAIKLKDELTKYQWFETYPGYLARQVLGLKEAYQKKKAFDSNIFNQIDGNIKVLAHEFNNWHRFDAYLAWLSGLRFNCDKHLTMGDPKEGLIIV
ncbi:MAG: DUF429 domain-containing protein [Saprospiraceae bacterium]|nr:DUF429 domain-containing protein [Saprospiraceae bacterium]